MVKGSPVCLYDEVTVDTKGGISVFDITKQIQAMIEKDGLMHGTVTIMSRHTTTAITINEFEPRLVEDIRLWLHKKAPPSDMYLHNDMDQRVAPDGWPGGWEAWAAQEPINAHSHLLGILVGNSESIPVMDGKLKLGTWQSVLVVELDGPRRRSIGVQFVGLQESD